MTHLDFPPISANRQDRSSIATFPRARKLARTNRSTPLRVVWRWHRLPALRLLAPEYIKAGSNDDGRARQSEEIGNVAEHHIAEYDRPHDHCILIWHDDAGWCQLQRAVDARERNNRNHAKQRQQHEIAERWHNPSHRREYGTEQQRGDDLPGDENYVRRLAEHARGDHQNRKENAAAQRDQRRQREARSGGTQRQHDADKSDRHGAPAAPAHDLAKQDDRHRGYINRTRE